MMTRTDWLVVLTAGGLLALGGTLAPSTSEQPADPPAPILRIGAADPMPAFSIPDYCAPVAHRAGKTFESCYWGQVLAGAGVEQDWKTYPASARIACSGTADNYIGLLNCFWRAGFRAREWRP
jgi:hypothetical protein